MKCKIDESKREGNEEMVLEGGKPKMGVLCALGHKEGEKLKCALEGWGSNYGFVGAFFFRGVFWRLKIVAIFS